MIIDEVKPVPKCNLTSENGSFAIASPDHAWMHCRESFAANWLTNEPIYFYCHRPKSVAAFIAKTEQIVGFGESVFAFTPHPRMLWVQTHDFWHQDAAEVRRSLFTALLRAGDEYNLDVGNYEQALYATAHLRETKDAVMRFLFGFTRFNMEEVVKLLGWAPDYKNGWYHIFSGRSRATVRTLLLPVEGAPRTMICNAELWT